MSVIVSASSLNNKVPGCQLSMDHSSNLEIDPLNPSLPQQLPPRGLTPDEFDLWKNELLLFLKNENKYQYYLPGGLYDEWTPAVQSHNGLCIQELHPQDPVNESLTDDFKKLLTTRNSDLQEMMTIIYELNNECGKEEIFELSNCFEGLMMFISESHCSQRNSEAIFDVNSCDVESSDSYQAFYLKFRASICTNLKKKGDVVEFLNGELLEDEILSPTFEEIIVLWCIEKIDPELPQLVRKTFRDKLQGNITVRDLQEEIFTAMPKLMDSLDKNERRETVIKHGVNGEILQDDEIENKVSITRVYTCKICEKSFANRRRLNLHQRSHAGNFFPCDQCEAVFESESKQLEHSFEEHLNESDNLGNEDYMSDSMTTRSSKSKRISDESGVIETCVCEFCNKTFYGRPNLNSHRYRMHKITLECGKCKQKFSTRSKFDSHMKKHSNEEMKDTEIECPICDKTLIGKEKYNLHIYYHKYQKKDLDEDDLEMKAEIEDQKETVEIITEDQLICELKEDSAEPETPTENKSKIILHKREKEHTCNICGKKFYDKKTMIMHTEKHKLEALKCIICDKKCKTNKLLGIHMKKEHDIQEEDKTIPCDVCGKLFKNKNLLKSHLRIHSEDWHKFKCEVCERFFSTENLMNMHICKHYSCDQCDREFVKFHTLTMHKREHEGVILFPCDQCESLFDKRKRLTEHKRFSHLGVKRHKCDFCGKEFAQKCGLNNHIRIHTGERPFKCEECGQSFKQRGALSTHKKMHTNTTPYECNECQQKFRTLSLLKTHTEVKHFDEKNIVIPLVES